MDRIYKYILENITPGKIEKQTAIEMIKMLKQESYRAVSGDVAVIGISGKFAGAENKNEFWNNLVDGEDLVGDVSEIRKQDVLDYADANDLKTDIMFEKGAFLKEIDKFDYDFFKLTPKEASLMDPNQRLFLQVAYHTFEDSGYGGEKIKGTNTGIFVGFSASYKHNYYRIISTPEDMGISLTGNMSSIIPGRVSYLFDLKGPSVVVDTACSSSLVAVHLACKALTNNECEMALAGGLKINLLPIQDGSKIGIESTDDRTHAFDDGADGTGLGEGVAAVLLKPLSKALKDGDHIYAVIKGSAINQDGTSAGMTAPNSIAQSEVIKKAWDVAKIDPESISYIEAHGTGTNLGDPIEIKGIQNAFRKYTDKKQFCGIGSLKTNIGHLYEGSGIASFIKVALALKNKALPASLHFEKPSSKINFEDSPVYVNDKLAKWEGNGNPLRCGVSAFGFSGTNCHIVLEEAPVVSRKMAPIGKNIFTVSAKSTRSLNELIKSYILYLESNDESLLEDICYTANTGRGHYSHRIAFIADDLTSLKIKLDKISKDLDANSDFYYGIHRRVASEGLKKEISDISEVELRDISLRANKFLELYSQGDELSLDELLKLYIKGADIEWEKLYDRIETKKASLPLYPFESTRCWIKMPSNIGRNSRHLYHGVKWEQSKNHELYCIPKGISIVVIKDDESMGNDLKTMLENAGNTVYELNTSSENFSEEYTYSFFKNMEQKPLDMVVYMATLNDDMDNLKQLHENQRNGLQTMLFLTKALLKTRKENVDIIAITKNANIVLENQKINPNYGSIIGFGRVIWRESNTLRCRVIDIDDNTSPDEILEHLVFKGHLIMSALRGGKCYNEVFSEIDLGESTYEAVPLKSEGVYIITGGLGGIGIETARYLASRKNVNLALINRSKMPNRDIWDEICLENKDERLIKRIKALKELESLGSKVEIIDADVSNLDEMRIIIENLRNRFGRLNGVIHGAGISNDGLILNKSTDQLETVLASKIYGAYVLDTLTKNDNLDFFVMYSSIASLINSPGQSAYAAANSFMDSYGQYMNSKGRNAYVVRWAAWKETGMASDLGVNSDGLFKTLGTERAINALDRVLGENLRDIFVGELNYLNNGFANYDRFPFGLSEEIIVKINNQNGKKVDETKNKKSRFINANIKGRSDNQYNEIEKMVGTIYLEVLGYDEIDINDSFFDIGGNSLLLTKLHQELENEYPGKLTVADLFSYNTIANLSEYLQQRDEKPLEIKFEKEQISGDIAIVGLAARFPKAKNKDEFWDVLQNGIDCITNFPFSREKDISAFADAICQHVDKDVEYAQGGYLEDIDKFDYSFFKITPKEASYMDPNQRLFLEAAWKAIEDAGYGGKKLSGTKTGVFIGFARSNNDYDKLISLSDPFALSDHIVGNLASIIPSRISFILDLKGPSMMVDTACSSSLVALHLACKAIQTGDCDAAIAGGVKISLMPIDFKKMGKGIGIESTDGKAYTFDDNSEGTGWGEGTAAVLLKPLSSALRDKDNIYAVIKGSAVNQDGACSGITAPNPLAQAKLFEDIWRDTGINPETISYIEAHGTGTKLGDPIEIDAIHKAMTKFTDKKQFCAIGSVKTNIGHLDNAAGIAGVVKAALALKNKKIPPTLNFKFPNRNINFVDSPVYVNDKLVDWNSDEIKRCGVSAFGFSGTNCHIIMEEAPQVQCIGNDSTSNVFAISAKSINSLKSIIKNYKNFFEKEPELNIKDVCYTLETGRGHYDHRLAFVVKDMNQLMDTLEKLEGIEDFGLTLPNGVWYNDIKNLEGNGIISSKIASEVSHTISEYIESNENDNNLLDKICQLYSNGGDFDWELLYNLDNVQKVSLPTYAFDKKRCWLKIPETSGIYSRSEEQLFYKFTFKLNDKNQFNSIPKGKSIVVIKNKESLEDRLVLKLRESGNRVLEVIASDSYQKISDDFYKIDNSEEGFNAFTQKIKDESLDMIINLMTFDEKEPKTLEDFDEIHHNGVFSMLYLTKGLLKTRKEKVEIIVVLKNAKKVIEDDRDLVPYNSTLIGFSRAVMMENNIVQCRVLDIDNKTSLDEILGYLTDDGPLFMTAIRDGKSYNEVLNNVEIKKIARKDVTVKNEGIYIITGGLGGIGIETAKYLASKGNVNLALINRSSMPDRENWQEILDVANDERSIKRIQSVKLLEELGAKVDVINADVSNVDEMRTILDNLRIKFGKINGIIHGAGISNDGLIINKKQEQFEPVLAPKVLGTWVLDTLTLNDKLDFFVMYSSIASFMNAPGQSAYAAANAFMDDYGQYMNSQGRNAYVINWSAWKETGMAKDLGANNDGLFKALETKKAIKALDSVLVHDQRQAIIGELDFENNALKQWRKFPFELSVEVMEKINENAGKNTYKNENDILKDIKVKLKGKSDDKYTDTEKMIGAVYQDVLGYEEIDIYKSFFDMGGDSILIVKMNEAFVKYFPGRIAVTDLFACPSISKLAEFLGDSTTEDKTQEIEKCKMVVPTSEVDEKDIAIIGISMVMPKSRDIDEFWKNLCEAKDLTTELPESRRKDVVGFLKSYNDDFNEDVDFVRGGYLEEIDKFDNAFFRISPKEAAMMDPNHRIFLQNVWKAVEDSGYGGGALAKTSTGVYIGFAKGFNGYDRIITAKDPSLLNDYLTGNLASVIPSRISYLLDLEGPTMLVDTACSSTLVAIHLACRGIRSGDCDMAIAGGVKINLLPSEISTDGKQSGIGIESSDGRTRAFDNDSDGTGWGEGVGAIILKPLSKAIEDRDGIYAVIKGSAINQDGKSIGMTAPNAIAQSKVIEKAWKDARVEPESITYIEAHGTGTKLGDPIEIDGLRRAFEKYTDKAQFCGFGSVKTNIGHLDTASGISGIIKAVMSLKNRKIPASLHFNNPNKNITFENSPVYINDRLRDWESNWPLRCGVSAFGFSGTNCHVILEEPPELDNVDENSQDKGLHVFTLSAKSIEALKGIIKEYARKRTEIMRYSLVDILNTANTGRGHYNHRLALIIKDKEELFDKLTKLASVDVTEIKMDSMFYGFCDLQNDGLDVKAKEHDGIFEQFNKCRTNESELIKICLKYIAGEDIGWASMYKGYVVNKVHLPTYVFDAKRCWIDLPNTNRQSAHLYHGIRWLENKLTTSTRKLGEGTCLIFEDENSIAEELGDIISEDMRVIRISHGNCFERLADNAFTISDAKGDYDELFSCIDIQSISMVIHTMSLTCKDECLDLEDLKGSQEKGVISLFHITKQLSQSKHTIDFILVSDYVNEITGKERKINAAGAAFLGLAKVINCEYPDFTVRCIDIDDRTDCIDIVKEIDADHGQLLVAYRNNKRFVEEFYSVPVEDTPKQEIEIKSDGAYVITGGLGGIGVNVAKYLSRSKPINIAFINRTPMPERELWDSAIKGEDKKIAKRIADIYEVEACGSKVVCYGADVANLHQISGIMSDIRRQFGKINGVIHSAGVAGDGFIVTKEDGTFKNVLAPKIEGTWIMDEVTKDDKLDFLVLFSSIASVFSSPGQGDYVAANAFMDSYSKARNKKGKKTKVINWAAWKETGMAYDYGSNADGVFKALSTRKAISAFDEVMTRDIDRIILGEVNYVNEELHKIEQFPFVVSDEIKNQINNHINNKKGMKPDDSNSDVVAKAKVVGKDNPSSTEKKVANIWREFLGFDEIKVSDSLYELGGDSLLGLKIVNNINRLLEININLTELLNSNCFEDFCDIIDKKHLKINCMDDDSETKEIRVLNESVDNIFPVSSAQKRVYLLNMMSPEETNYNMPGALIINGTLDIKKAESAFRKIIKRHETLRTFFYMKEDEIVQEVLTDVDFTVSFDEVDETLLDAVIKEFIKPFDLEKAPLLRIKFIKLGAERFAMLYDMHHIISDGESFTNLMREFEMFYLDKELPALEMSYKDYAIMQREQMSSGVLKIQEDYWLNEFRGELPVLSLPTDKVRPQVQSSNGDLVSIHMDKSLIASIAKMASNLGTTLYNVLLASYNVLLSRYSNQDDIIVGIPVLGRKGSELEPLIGMFVNTLAIRSNPDANKEFKTFVQEIKNTTLKAYENQDYQFEEIVDKLNLSRDTGRNPLFDTMFSFLQVNDEDMLYESMKIEIYDVDIKSVKFDIAAEAIELDDGLRLNFEYSTDLFFKDTVERIASHYINILNSVLSNPGVLIGDIQMLSEKEKQDLVYGFNNNTAPIDMTKVLHNYLEENAEVSPTKIALTYKDQNITYKELNDKANRIGNYLLSLGLKSESLVGIFLERSPEMVESIVGVWKAGGAYMPLDVEYPIMRVVNLLEDSKAAFVITLSNYVTPELINGFGGKVIILDEIKDDLETQSIENPDISIDIKGLAYVLFTSGSTGKPKGAMIEHLGMINHMFAEINELGLDSQSVIAQNASHCFDISVWQFFTAFVVGGRTVIYNNQVTMDPVTFTGMIVRDEVSILEAVPSFLHVMLDYIEDNQIKLSKLLYLMITGETVKTQLVERCFSLLEGTKLVNAYGPAEASDDVTQYIMDRMPVAESIPVGKPVQNMRIYIVDENMNLCPVGVVGEICVAGIGVGRGYINDIERTTKSFIKDPFVDGNDQRLYKTGDLGRFLSDGNIEFYGRKDYQVKIRGYRIELGEIESRLAEYPGILETAVVDLLDENGIKYLSAFYTSKAQLENRDIKEFLGKALPGYMIPAVITKLNDMPLSSNGKIDRKVLADLQVMENQEILKELAENEVEAKLLEIWQDVLGVKGFGTNEDFFELGGHSLKAATLVSRIKKVFGVDVPLMDIFVLRSVKSMAEVVKNAKSSLYPEIKAVQKQEYYIASSAQKRLYLLSQMENAGINYNMPVVMNIEGTLDISKVEKAFKQIIEKHEVLRTSFVLVNGEVCQRVYDEIAFNTQIFECSENSIKDIVRDFIKPFNLGEAPLLRLGIIKLSNSKNILMLDIHHTVFDGISEDILIRDFLDGYVGNDLTKLSIQYKDFAAWQTELRESEIYKKQEAYWISELEGRTTSKDIPTDYPRPVERTFEGDRIDFIVDEAITTELRKLAVRTGTTMYMIMLTAYEILLSKYALQEDVVIGTVTSGRNVSELEDLIGMFVNTVVIRNILSPDMSFDMLLQEVKNKVVKAMENQDYPFEELVEKMGVGRNPARNPLFDMAFVYQNSDDVELKTEGLTFKPYEFDFMVAKFDITLCAADSGNSILCSFEYCSGLFTRETAEKLMGYFGKILETISESSNVQLKDIQLVDKAIVDDIKANIDKSREAITIDIDF